MRKIYLLTVILLLTLSFIHAEEIDSLTQKRIELEEVIVSSFKQDKQLRISPIAATTISSAAIRNRNITSMKDFSSYVPNLFIPDYGSKLTSPVFIRGIGSKINSPSVGLYIDGMPYFEKSAFDFDFAEIDQVEVLRGPQGTLYGRNTMGGIINVYTKSPLKYRGTHLGFSAGSYMNMIATASHYGKINDRVGYSISGNYHHSDGYFTNETTGNRADPLDEGSGRIRIDWQVNDALLLRVTSTVDYLDQGGYPYALLDTDTNRPGKVNYNDYSSYSRTISTSGINLDYTARSFQLNSQTTFQYLDDDQRIDQDFSPQKLYFATQKQTQKMFSEEINIKSRGNGNYKWLFGAFGFRQGIDNEVGVDYFAQEYATLKLYDVPTYGVAVYHQSTLDNLLVKGLSATVGIRYDYEQARTDYSGFRIDPTGKSGTEDFDSKLKFDQITPKFALQYTFPSSQMVYGTITKGYKTGGFNTTFERDDDKTFDPEYSWNYEIGAKLEFWDHRIKTEASLFYIDWKNQQIYQTPPSGVGQMLKNAGRSESKGVELSLQANLFNGFMAHVNYGYTDAKFKDYVKNEKADFTGNYIPLVPSHTFAAGIDYTIAQLLSLDRMTFSVNYTGTGKLYWNDENETHQDYYGLLNAKITGVKGILSISLWARNITNAYYTAYAFKSGNGWSGQQGKPFTIGANIALNF